MKTQLNAARTLGLMALLLVLLAGTGTVYAQRGKTGKMGKNVVAESEVPAAVVSAFKAKYASVSSVTWRKPPMNPKSGKQFYVAGFLQDGKRTFAAYDAAGAAKRVATFLTPEQLPAAVSSAAKVAFPGQTIKGGAKVERLVKKDVVYRVMLVGNGARVNALYTESGKPVDKNNQEPEDAEPEDGE